MVEDGAAEAEAARGQARGGAPGGSRRRRDEAPMPRRSDAKMANDAQKSDLDALSHAIGFKTAELRSRQAKGARPEM